MLSAIHRRHSAAVGAIAIVRPTLGCYRPLSGKSPPPFGRCFAITVVRLPPLRPLSGQLPLFNHYSATVGHCPANPRRHSAVVSTITFVRLPPLWLLFSYSGQSNHCRCGHCPTIGWLAILAISAIVSVGIVYNIPLLPVLFVFSLSSFVVAWWASCC